MTFRVLFWIFLILHVLVCIAVYICLRLRILKFTEQLFPILVFVPFWGFCIAVIAEWNTRRNKSGSRVIALEELHAGADDYRMLHVEEEEAIQEIVPLEEAILINDTETRRKLMLDILHQNPAQYIQLLQQARLNDDIEVTHYASTAMMEVQREYELELQKQEKQLNQTPDDEKALMNCIQTLRRYIDSGLIDDEVLYIQRKRYADLLSKRMEQAPDGKFIFYAAADNYLELEDYSAGHSLIDKVLEKWPEDENAWFLKLKYCQATNDGALLTQTVREIRRRNIYLSPAGKQTLQFWSRSLDREAEVTT